MSARLASFSPSARSRVKQQVMVDPDEALAERIAERFRAKVAARVPVRAAFADALVHEARPAVHALLFAVDTERATDPYSLEHHETTAMLTLLGRAFAMDGATPTAAMLIVPILLETFRAEGVDVPFVLDGPLQTVFVEGYVRGREERVALDCERLAMTRVGMSELVPGCLFMSLRGAFTHEALSDALDDAARALLRADASACVVDLRGFVDPTTQMMRLLGAFAETALGIGAAVRFVGDMETYRASLAGMDPRDPRPTIVPDGPAALFSAFADAGFSLRRITRIETSLRELMRSRRPS